MVTLFPRLSISDNAAGIFNLSVSFSSGKIKASGTSSGSDLSSEPPIVSGVDHSTSGTSDTQGVSDTSAVNEYDMEMDLEKQFNEFMNSY